MRELKHYEYRNMQDDTLIWYRGWYSSTLVYEQGKVKFLLKEVFHRPDGIDRNNKTTRRFTLTRAEVNSMIVTRMI